PQLRRIGIVRRQRVPVGDEVIAGIRVLQLDPILDGAEVVAEVNAAGRFEAAEDVFGLCHAKAREFNRGLRGCGVPKLRGSEVAGCRTSQPCRRPTQSLAASAILAPSNRSTSAVAFATPSLSTTSIALSRIFSI